jgi:hypothetical protein
MKTLEELKQYYSNATKEKIIFDNYQDMLRVVELQQENEQLKADYCNKAQVERDILLQQKEELIKWLMKLVEECDELVTLNSICAEGTKRTEDIAKLRKIVYQEILSKLKESDKDVS